MTIPTSLFHYFETSRAPFLSISELSNDEFSELMNQFSASATVENRFDEAWKRDFYIFFRPYTEAKVREQFIAKGGKPILLAPRYLTLGPTTWFNNWYLNPGEVEVPLRAIPEDVISFTYPDSMMSMLIAEDRYEPFAKFKQPCHGQVYRLSELNELIETYGMPNEDDPENLEFGNRIIEAQIWDLDVLTPFYRATP